MMTIYNRIMLYIATGFIVMMYTGCEKFLNEPQDDELKIPSDITDLQELLDDDELLRQRTPKAAEMSADDYYLTDAGWDKIDEFDRRMYTWDKEKLFSPGSNNDWGNAYYNVYVANTVLGYLEKIDRTTGDQDNWNDVKGQALFLRGQTFLEIASIWSVAYDELTAGTDLGIPLRLSMDLSEKIKRSSLKQTYDQVISDLKCAADLLPQPLTQIIHPTKAAAYALLARTYLSMRNYKNMGVYAGLCLQLKSTLKDFNSLSIASSFPFAPDYSNEEEIISRSSMITAKAFHSSRAKIDSTLYRSYLDNDLRKKIFFEPGNGFKGSYTGSAVMFSGPSTNEVYLMNAESFARSGNVSAAMKDLNKLLEKRFLAGTFVPLVAKDSAEALSFILTERRKELIMRGLRWLDVKRLNREGANIKLKRVINRQTYVLLPNDPKYALPIPEDEIKETGIVQNPR